MGIVLHQVPQDGTVYDLKKSLAVPDRGRDAFGAFEPPSYHRRLARHLRLALSCSRQNELTADFDA